MKTQTIPPTVRFTCRAVRGWISVFGDAAGGEPRGLGSGHIASCSECQEFFAGCGEFDVLLKRDAARAWQEPSTSLGREIMREVERAESGPARTRGWEARTPRMATWSLAGAAACAAVAWVAFQNQRAPGGTELPPTGVVATVNPQQLWASIKPSADSMLAAEPLQDEMEAMKSDARTAVRFLARNFLPASAEEISRSE